jgi:hypothetical protein
VAGVTSPADNSAQAREIAAQIERDFPQWLVMWGAYSREFWAFARFELPQGVIVHAADPDQLVMYMRDSEVRAAGWNTPGQSSAF